MHTALFKWGLAGCLLMAGLVGCAARRSPDLGEIYNHAAQNIGDERNPVIVIPGVLGSRLEDSEDDRIIWGAFIYGAADADLASGARLVSLPMERGKPLRELRDSVEAIEALDTIPVDLALIRRVEIRAYAEILRTLAVGQYRDSTIDRLSPVDYGGSHYTCFQFAYDWRRDLSEQAAKLDNLVRGAQAMTRSARGDGEPVRVDIVAHSMGGLLLRYYLRYGGHPLPEDGSLPELTWAGARNIEKAIVVAPPNAGTPLALKQLVEGVQFSRLTPYYRPALLGTMPGIYQLLPRPRHGRVVDAESGEPIDILDPEVWERYGWGLADPGQEGYIGWLLPEVDSAEDRREIALDHLRKSLARAEQFFRAIDIPASPPEHTDLILIAGDAYETVSSMSANPETGALRVHEKAPGDGTVTRASALMDERVGGMWRPRLRTPIDWRTVHFLDSEHLAITKDPMFTDIVLYTLLEAPRSVMSQSPVERAADADEGDDDDA